MKTSHIFVLSALVISGAFFGALSLFELPETTTEWILSDIILGTILYVNYLVIAMAHGSSKTRKSYSVKKVTA
jgi:hypothetical protein